MMPFRLRDQRGLTLLEVTVSLTLLSLVMLSLLYVLANSVKATNSSKDRLRATSLASSLLEYLGTTPTEDLTRFHGVDTREPGTFPGDAPSNAICLRWKSEIPANMKHPEAYGTVQVEANSPAPGRTRITVEVLWSSEKLRRVSLVEVR